MEKAPVFVAIDTPDIDRAVSLSTELAPHLAGIKLGLEFFLAHGHEGVKSITKALSDRDLSAKIFLDLKLHDIPNTVAKAIYSLADLNVDYLTVHTSGGNRMLQAAQIAAEAVGIDLLGVTILTSISADNFPFSENKKVTEHQLQQHVLHLAMLAKNAGLKGVVASAKELKILRTEFDYDLEIVTPGIRPTWAATNDQQRIVTPKDAYEAGATYLVIGRPITASNDIAHAMGSIAYELKQANASNRTWNSLIS